MFDNLGDDLADIGYSAAEGFNVDTILAYLISALNNKGYTTIQCCEGHPLVNARYEHIDEYKQRMYSVNSDIDKMFDVRENDDGEKYVCFQGEPDVGAFVIFDDEISLSTIPEGWVYEAKGLIQIGTMKELYRKCAVFYSAIGTERPPKEFELNNIENVTKMQTKRDLNPVLRKGEHFDLNLVQEEVKCFLSGILVANNNEKMFWENFSEGNYKPELLFAEDIGNIEKHPMALWKCRNKQ